MRVGLTAQTLKNGAFNLATSRITADKINPQGVKINDREQQVLDAAAKLAKPGETVSPTALSHKLGIGRNYVSMVISKLRAKGVWKYASPPKGRVAGVKAKPVVVKVKAEVKSETMPAKKNDPNVIFPIMERICEELKPLDKETIQRVLECIATIMLPKNNT